MNDERDGGAAFPGKRRGIDPYDGSTIHVPCPGMSLRDYFAGLALNGLLSDAESLAALRTGFASDVPIKIAMGCYDFADAMLQARKAK